MLSLYKINGLFWMSTNSTQIKLFCKNVSSGNFTLICTGLLYRKFCCVFFYQFIFECCWLKKLEVKLYKILMKYQQLFETLRTISRRLFSYAWGMFLLNNLDNFVLGENSTPVKPFIVLNYYSCQEKTKSFTFIFIIVIIRF